jgi:hypothetical protein
MEILQNGFCMIPNVVLYDNELSDKQKLLYWVISSLCAEKWYCRASNDYISELLWVNKWTISKNISELEKKWYINITLDSNYKRYIELNSIVENHNDYEKSQGGLWKITRGDSQKSQDINIIDKYKINNNENSQEQSQEQPQDTNISIPKQKDSNTHTKISELDFIKNSDDIRDIFNDDEIAQHKIQLKIILKMVELWYKVKKSKSDIEKEFERLKAKAKLYWLIQWDWNIARTTFYQKIDKRFDWHTEKWKKVKNFKTSIIPFISK